MKILILGGSGMLGHQLWRHFHHDHETWVTLRKPVDAYLKYGIFDGHRVCPGIDMTDMAQITQVMRDLRPDAVINCVGIIKQLKEAKSPIPSITINALFPHRLADVCAQIGARLLLFSTDCVFSGKRGNYSELDPSDAEDLYGKTKYLGEIADLSHVVTLRSSIIGRELGTAHSLIDWFIGQNGTRVRGYRQAIYTGITTLEMARIVDCVLSRHEALSGLWQVASERITKHDLLSLVRSSYSLDIEIEAFDGVACDRSLDGTRFEAATGYRAPSWPTMIDEMASLDRRR